MDQTSLCSPSGLGPTIGCNSDLTMVGARSCGYVRKMSEAADRPAAADRIGAGRAATNRGYVYAIAIGSNRRGRHGGPRDEVAAAIAALDEAFAISPIVATTPIGPSIRQFANACVLIESDEAPEQLLQRLKAIEVAFGRRGGQRWAARVIDLDIILWSGGCWSSRMLTIPHRLFRTRSFVLTPLATIAASWRDPVTTLTVRQLEHAVDPRRRCP